MSSDPGRRRFTGTSASPTTARPGGRGLWITHQVCSHVVAQRTPEGHTLRLTAGDTR